MPNINISDSRQRDAVVKAENRRRQTDLRYLDPNGAAANTRKILKATAAQDYQKLLDAAEGDSEELAKALVEGDPEIDLETFGCYLWDTSRVFVSGEKGTENVVYRIEQEEVVKGPDGKEKERRPLERPEPNTDAEIPLAWSGRKVPKEEAIRKFVFANKLQIQHVNGLTYDFLYGMAKELAEENCLMLLGGGEQGKEPLIFRRGSLPYRGFLEGRVEGDKYALILHLSNFELKQPAVDK